MENKRHVLITGGAGYIGSLLTAELLRSGYRVSVLDKLLFGGESLLAFMAHPDFYFARADITGCIAIVRQKIVVQSQSDRTHLAAPPVYATFSAGLGIWF